MYIHVKAITGAKKESVVQAQNADGVLSPDHFVISIKELPERNMANKRILEIMREKFVGKAVRMVSGHHSPSKIISIE
ncbi:MAG: hypothetical protein RIT04_141 [Candidatus Parcubacteria bacterium]|jgi:uncharacterized protein YggU (UPF0235/DUF167 family)